METKINFSDIRSELVHITPGIARDYLTHNVSNRRLTRSIVNLYIRLLSAGQFKISNDAICFDKTGKLLNGQHRLTACVESGIAFDCFVAHNMPTESFAVMDNGKNRTAGDVLHIQDVKESSSVAAIIRRYTLLCRNRTALDRASESSDSKITNSEVEKEYHRDGVFWSTLTRTANNCAKHSKWHLLKSSDIGGFSAYLILVKKHPEQRVFDFFDQVEGRQAVSSSVITLLQQRLLDSKRNPQRKLLSSVAQKLIIKAWNAFITGKEYKSFFYNEKSDKDLWFV